MTSACFCAHSSGAWRPVSSASRVKSASERCCAAAVFRVFERQVEERPLVRAERAVEARGHGRFRDAQRPRVAGEHPRGAAIEVARELIEQQDQSQRTARLGRPGAECTASAAVTAVPKRSRMASSNAGSLRNHSSRAPVPSPNQKSRMPVARGSIAPDMVRPARLAVVAALAGRLRRVLSRPGGSDRQAAGAKQTPSAPASLTAQCLLRGAGLLTSRRLAERARATGPPADCARCRGPGCRVAARDHRNTRGSSCRRR